MKIAVNKKGELISIEGHVKGNKYPIIGICNSGWVKYLKHKYR